jgi:hypothetical protein
MRGEKEINERNACYSLERERERKKKEEEKSSRNREQLIMHGLNTIHQCMKNAFA